MYPLNELVLFSIKKSLLKHVNVTANVTTLLVYDRQVDRVQQSLFGQAERSCQFQDDGVNIR